MIKLIAFAGGCFSGKTTAMNMLKARLEKNNDSKVILLNELMRSRFNELTEGKYNTIDELRQFPSEYLKVQKVIIPEKINLELQIKTDIELGFSNEKLKDIKSNRQNTYVLIDRSIADSMFYLTFYTAVNFLSRKEIEEFNNLFLYVDTYARILFDSYYDKVFMFSPLDKVTGAHDNMRPNYIHQLKYTEYNMINTFVNRYAGANNLKVAYINPNDYDIDSLPDLLEEYI